MINDKAQQLDQLSTSLQNIKNCEQQKLFIVEMYAEDTRSKCASQIYELTI